MLGDLGADVIKVEQPGRGDEARRYGPPFLHESAGRGGLPEDALSALYLACNRNKRAVTLDFTTDRGRELAVRLIAHCDVVLENFRPGVLDRHGLGWHELHDRFRGLVMCSVTGFGQNGPYRRRPGYGGIFQAISGMMSVSGVPDGEPGAGPMKSGPSLIAVVTGLYTSTALLAALRHRDRTGVGQHLDVSLLDCGIASLSHDAESYLVSGEVPQRRGNGGFGGIPSQAFECADGRLIFIVETTNPQFSRACEAFGRPVNDIREALADEQVQFRELQMSMHDAALGDVAGLRYPVRLSATPVTDYSFPPRLGQDTSSVYRELLGLSPGEIDQLAAAGVI